MVPVLSLALTPILLAAASLAAASALPKYPYHIPALIAILGHALLVRLLILYLYPQYGPHYNIDRYLYVACILPKYFLHHGR
jgi:hypothetical protein